MSFDFNFADSALAHSALFTGAGTPWGPSDTQPAWANTLGLNINPKYSDVFRNVVVPVVEVAAVVVATYFTAGLADEAIAAGGVAVGAGAAAGTAAGASAAAAGAAGATAAAAASAAATAAVASSASVIAFSTGIGLTAGGALMVGMDALQAQLGIPPGQGLLAENKDKIAMALAGSFLAANPPDKPMSQIQAPDVPPPTLPTTQQVQDTGQQLLNDLKPKAAAPAAKPAASVVPQSAASTAAALAPTPLKATTSGESLLGMVGLGLLVLLA